MSLGRFLDSRQSHKSADSFPSPQTGAERPRVPPEPLTEEQRRAAAADRPPRLSPARQHIHPGPRTHREKPKTVVRADLGSQMQEATFQEKDGVKGLIRAFATRKDTSSLRQKERICSQDEWFWSAKAGSRALGVLWVKGGKRKGDLRRLPFWVRTHHSRGIC